MSDTDERKGKIPKRIGWWEEYRCGCTGQTEKFKKDLLGYCATHGDDRRYIHPEVIWVEKKVKKS